jgi:hypothetical protein
MPPSAGETPPWADDIEAMAEERKDMQFLLRRGQRMFRKLQNPDMLEPNDAFTKVFNGLSNAALDALMALFNGLDRCLFDSPSTIYRSTEPEQRYLVQYVTPRQIDDFRHYIRSAFDDTNSSPFPGQNGVIAYFTEWVTSLISSLNVNALNIDPHFIAFTSSEAVALQQWRRQLTDALNTFQTILEAENARETAVQAASDTIRARDAARRAAGDYGNLVLGQHFRDIAQTEEKAERNWTVGLLVALLVTLLVGSLVVRNFAADRLTETLLHLTVVIPILGAASYASRIARHHRMLARWAKTASVQINSVEAFAQQLSSTENQDKLILELGRNVFSPPALGEDGKSDHYSAIPSDLMDVLKDIAKKLGPGSSQP